MKICPKCLSVIIDVDEGCETCSFPHWSGELRLPIDDKVVFVGLFSTTGGLHQVWIDDKGWITELNLRDLSNCNYDSLFIEDMIQKLSLKRDEIFVKNLNRLVEG